MPQIDADYIAKLYADQIPEGRELDYKRDLPGNSRDDKNEFLRDVAAFANTGGGMIVFGIEETKDANGKNTGLPGAIVGLPGVNLDEEVRRLDQIVRSGLAPRLPGHAFHGVDRDPGPPVIVLTIQQSWLKPHMVATSDDTRFYARNARGKFPLDVTQIRSAFLQSEAIPSAIKRFRSERLGMLLSDETPVPVREGPKAMLHIVPYAAFGGEVNVDLVAWDRRRVTIPGDTLMDSHFNADGHVGFCGKREQGHRGYIQLFRDGSIEVCCGIGPFMYEGKSPPKVIWPASVEDTILDGLRAYVPALIEVGAALPLSVSATLVGVRGYGVSRSAVRVISPIPIARDVVHLPDVLVEDAGAVFPALLRPMFDGLWQTLGRPRSLSYDDQGRWINKRERFVW